MDRKQFLIKGGRILILGGIAACTGYLVVNDKVDASCSVSSSCEKCGKLTSCELPQAKEVGNGKK